MDTSHLPLSTATLLARLLEMDLGDFVLIGGTAMALQCGHRISEDLDFWLPQPDMTHSPVDSVIRSLSADGSSVRLTTSHSQIIKAKINGFNLLDCARDYAIDGVKVTFMSRNDSAFRAFQRHLPLEGRVMPLEGIFAMKAYVITKRVRSRDLFDLLHFLQHGKTLDNLFDALQESLPDGFSREEIKSILVGEVSLDKNDEGIQCLTDISIADVYAGLSEIVNQHERDYAQQVSASA